MSSIVFKSTMPAVITKFTTAALLLLALAACDSGGGGSSDSVTKKTTSTSLKPTELVATGVNRGINLTWKEATGATSYTVYYHTASFDSTADSGVKSKTGITTTNYNITGLTDGTTYYLQVAAISAAGNYLSQIVTATTNLQAPTGLKATGVDGGIGLTWNKAEGATSYTVYYHTASFDSTADSGVKSKTGITTTNYSITGLTNGTKYHLRVEAISANGDKKLSEEVSATVPIQKPTNLKATGIKQGVILSWGKVEGATSYTVYYRKDISFDSATVNLAKSKTGITTINTRITDLSNDATYYLRVEAISANGDKKLSEEVSTTTEMDTPPQKEFTEIYATGIIRGVVLRWNAITGATSYNVYYHTASFDSTDDGVVKSETVGDITNIIISGLADATKYYLRVETINSDGETKLSEEVSAFTILEPPTKLQAKARQGAIDLTWDAVDRADSYKVYYHTVSFDSTDDSVLKSKTVIAPATDTSIDGLLNGTKYFIRLVANVTKGNIVLSSVLSTEVSAITILPAPTKLQAKARQGAIDLSWDAVDKATNYTVYYRKDNSFDSISDSTADGVIQNKTGIKTTSTSITGLDGGTTYHFRVIASNVIVSSALSPIKSATTKLPAPINLSGVVNFLGVDLSWDAVTNATGYRIYYSDGTTDTTTDTIGLNSIIASISDLSSGITYSFQVAALASGAGITKSTPPLSLTIPVLTAPQNLSAAASINSLAAVDLSWDTVAGVTGYKIYYADVSLDGLNGGYQNFAAVDGKLAATTDTSVTIGDLSADTTYYFVVEAYYNEIGGNGEKEAAASEVSTDSSYIAELAMGGEHGCVRLNTGSIKCWGKNDQGQLGVGGTNPRNIATNVSGNLPAKQLSAGDRHSCAIDLSDKLWCWGDNDYSQLGLSGGDRIRPTLVTQAKLAKKVSLVSAGKNSTCAQAEVSADGKNFCWGSQFNGALGDGVSGSSFDSIMDAKKINDITPDVKQFALGSNSGCAIDASDDLWCWGSNGNGQVGHGTAEQSYTSPVNPLLQVGSKATMVAGKDSHYCAVDKAKKIQCWGRNNNGQLGINSTDKSNIPQYVLTSDLTSDHLSKVSKIATGHEHSCALIKDSSVDSSVDSRVRCWGGTNSGIIGTNGGKNRLVANTDMPINNAIDIAAGADFTCVLLADKASVKCWGSNGSGQLGNGRSGQNAWSYTPVAVKWK